MEPVKSYREAAQLPVHLPAAWNSLTTDDKAGIARWIAEHISPAPDVHPTTSADLKDLFSKSHGGFYVTNGQFKGAMRAAGYEAVDESMVNWAYRITVKP